MFVGFPSILGGLGALYRPRFLEEYFGYGGEALVLTLHDGLGEALTEEIKQAWVAVYDFIAANIISGLRFAREKAPGHTAYIYI